MTDPSAPDEARLRQVFDAAARNTIFPRAPIGDRLLVLLGGQPAAGKTRAQAAILAEHPELAPITGDDLRAYHPDYRNLAVNDPLGMPAATAPTSSGLIRLALDYAIEHGYPVLLEGTFRDPAMVSGTAVRFAQAGYRVEVVTVATPAPVSRLSAEERFLRAPRGETSRWTPPDAHETALAASPEVVAARHEREHERAAPAVLPGGHRPLTLIPRRPRRRRARAEHPATQAPRLAHPSRGA